jgi:phosphate starvation-inducible PhoH-like protein
MQQQKRATRKEKVQQGTQRVVKEKFAEQREQSVRAKPLVAMNSKQRTYIELLNEKPIVVATGYAGTSKTYVPTVMAADLYKLGAINKIIITRPAVSTSKSVGFFKGTAEEKLSTWLGSVIPIFKERLGAAMFEIALESGDIEFVPLEVLKGMSINDAWLLVEESSDLSKDEVIKIVTRMGKNSKLVLAGDIRQSELKHDCGLAWLQKFIERHGMHDTFGHIDFNDVNDIVRSDAVRSFIVNLVRDEKRGIS